MKTIAREIGEKIKNVPEFSVSDKTREVIK